MPLIISTSSSSSSDGIVAARVDDEWSGVLVQVTLPSAFEFVTIVRTDPDGTRSIVRSGDHTRLHAGFAVCYDHEAPLGVPVTYTCLRQGTRAGPDLLGRLPGDPDYGADPGRHADGTYDPQTANTVLLDRQTAVGRLLALGKTSAGHTVTIPDPGITLLKPVAMPSLMASFRVREIGPRARDRGSNVLRIAGDAFPRVLQQARSAAQYDLTAHVETQEQLDGLALALGHEGVFLLQAMSGMGLPDMFVQLPTDTESFTSMMLNNPDRLWQMKMVQVSRPGTAESRLRIPGKAFADQAGPVSGASGTYASELLA